MQSVGPLRQPQAELPCTSPPTPLLSPPPGREDRPVRGDDGQLHAAFDRAHGGGGSCYWGGGGGYLEKSLIAGGGGRSRECLPSLSAK